MHPVAVSGAMDELVTGGSRGLNELKQEVQRRADRNMPPLGGIGPEDARTALARIDSLGRDQWALAWSSVAEQHLAKAQSPGGSDADAVRDHYWHAWRLYHFARWPVENSPVKVHAKQRALEAFRSYSRLLEPPLEVVHMPFESKEIVAYLRLPANVRPAPVVFGIAGLDSRKEDIAAFSDRYLRHGVGLFAIDLPGTGEAPIATATTDSDRMFSAALDYLATRPERGRRHGRPARTGAEILAARFRPAGAALGTDAARQRRARLPDPDCRRLRAARAWRCQGSVGQPEGRPHGTLARVAGKRDLRADTDALDAAPVALSAILKSAQNQEKPTADERR